MGRDPRKMPKRPPWLRDDTKAIQFPSGDHAGCASSTTGVPTRMDRSPGTCRIQMPRCPLSSDVYARLRPSGDQLGASSRPGSLVILARSYVRRSVEPAPPADGAQRPIKEPRIPTPSNATAAADQTTAREPLLDG